MPLLELKNVSSAYGSVEALRGVSLHVEKGEIVTLLGANGAGKSTTLRTISGLIRPTSGEIWFEGHRIDTLAPEQIVRSGISHVPEGRRIFPGLTVRENIMLGSTSRGHLSKQMMAEDVEQMFGIFPDIKRFEHSLGWTLSGGQQQMLAVARGLMAKPKLLLLDEPTAGMSAAETTATVELIRRLQRERAAAVLVIEHDMSFVRALGCPVVVMLRGTVLFEGSYDQVHAHPEVREAYLGHAAQ